MSNFSAPKKALGQNFLQDANIIEKIVAALGVKAGEAVIEIGPGRGALTELLIPKVDELHLIEFDHELVDYWTTRSLVSDSLFVHGVDVLKFDFNQLQPLKKSKFKIIGNLPYNISSPVLFHLMRFIDLIECQVVMLQKEVVQRMSAKPGGKDYGRLSVMLQQRYDIEYLFKVPPGAFFPPPKVDSAIARLTPLNPVLHPVHNNKLFESVVKTAFSQRRKTLRNTLKGVASSEQMESCNIDPSARAETISVEQFTKLTNLLVAD